MDSGGVDRVGNLEAAQRRGEVPAVLAGIDELIAEGPPLGAAWGRVAALAREVDDLDAAIIAARRWFADNPDDIDRRALLGELLGKVGAVADALELAIPVGHEFPRAAQVRYGIGVIEARAGHFERAARNFADAIELLPSYTQAWEQLATVSRFAVGDDWIARFQEAERHIGVLKPAERLYLHYALGKLYADLGEHDWAFAHYRDGAALARAARPFDAGQHAALIDDVIARFPAAGKARKGRKAAKAQDGPVFIVGVARSGTTLAERILAAHSGVRAAGECGLLRLALARRALTTWQEGPAADPETLKLRDWRALGAEYLRRMARHLSLLPEGGGEGSEGAAPAERPAGAFTDKTLSNYLHIGWIARALPAAKIVHCRRDALDTAWSCYSTLFGRGNRYSHDFGDIARYMAGFNRLMDHWRALYPERIFTLDYETLVRRPEVTVLKLVEFCGLEMEAACLTPERGEGAITTASLVPARRAINPRAVGRSAPYHAHMAEWLDALRDAGGGNGGE